MRIYQLKKTKNENKTNFITILLFTIFIIIPVYALTLLFITLPVLIFYTIPKTLFKKINI